MLPPPLMNSTPGSFAEHTIKVRKPGILAKVIATQHYAPDIVDAVQRFGDEIREGVAAPLKEKCPDRPLWNRALAPWEGKRWTELPGSWRTYFYRRLLRRCAIFSRANLPVDLEPKSVRPWVKDCGGTLLRRLA